MKLSEKAEEILEALWVTVEEGGAAFLDPEKLGFPADDPAYQELTGNAMIEIRQGMIYFRPEGLNEGKMTIRRHRASKGGRSCLHLRLFPQRLRCGRLV